MCLQAQRDTDAAEADSMSRVARSQSRISVWSPLREGLLAHERAADLRVGPKDGPGEAVIAVHVGIEEPCQLFQGSLSSARMKVYSKNPITTGAKVT